MKIIASFQKFLKQERKEYPERPKKFYPQRSLPLIKVFEKGSRLLLPNSPAAQHLKYGNSKQ
jgi:hypothetical protein